MRAIRITRANWLNDEVGGDQGTVKLVTDEMARDAVEVHRIAVYAPEYDRPAFVGPEKAAERLEELREAAQPEVADFGPPPVQQTEDDLAGTQLPELSEPGMADPKATWVTWAAHGDHAGEPITEKKAAELTKNQLMHRYGSRL